MSVASITAPVLLAGHGVELQPLDHSHAGGLIAAYEPGTMDLFSQTDDVLEPLDADHARRYVDEALDGAAAGIYVPFAVVDRDSGTVLGSTRYGRIDPAIPRLEIGWTWYAPRVRGTSVNPACKLLLLEHAFEQLHCKAVTLSTSSFNLRSQRAIAKLGATRDGVLKRDRYQRDGRLRDTVVFTILDDEWPYVRERLMRRLEGGERTIETHAADVQVRLATGDDVDAFVDYLERNGEFHAPFAPLRSDRDVRSEAMERIDADARVQFVAVQDDRVVGQCSISNIAPAPVWRSCTIGYDVDHHCQGRGIASALVRHAVRHAFLELGLHRVEAGTLLDNRASQRVLERCGFTRIGVAPRHVKIAGSWQDHLLYVTTAEDLGVEP